MRGRPDGGTDATTPNWSGYSVTGEDFTSVEGSWTVPLLNCGGSSTPTTNSASLNGVASLWVGMGGGDPLVSSTSVQQIGTDSSCVKGEAQYSAWYEFYCEGEGCDTGPITFEGFTISAGDQMSATVEYKDSPCPAKPGCFVLSIVDLTTGKAPDRIIRNLAGARRGSAEWIAEDPGKPPGHSPLSA
jgi:hypothetical protein